FKRDTSCCITKEREQFIIPSSPPGSPHQVESMATEPGNRCPICLDSWDDAAYVMPCVHRFCYQCILRWAETKSSS
uniref:RING-type domain-containing protein n=1 Tax=Otus sunia TaxID=257818 RepID=A0A8C8B867_9STRI